MGKSLLIEVPLKDRVRMYLLVALICAGLALLLRAFLAGTDAPSNFAEQRLHTSTTTQINDLPRLATP